MLKIIKRAFVFCLAGLLIFPTSTFAISEATLDFFDQNHIYYYNPTGTANICYSSSMSGNTNFAKIANYFFGNNPYGISLSPEAVAGIIANFQAESGLSAFRNQSQYNSTTGDMSSSNGYGIAQFTGRDKILTPLKTDARTANYFFEYYNEKYGGTIGIEDDGIPDGVPEEVNDAWLAVQLDFIVSSEFMTTKVGSYRNYGGTMGLDYIPDSATILEAMEMAKSASDAARIFVWIYERPANKPGGAATRSEIAESILPDVSALGNNGVTSDAKNTGKNVTIIGDSLTVGSESAIKSLLPDADIHAQSSKQFYTGTDNNKGGYTILNDLASSNSLREIVVYALGTNSSITSEQAQAVINLAGSNRTVIFLTNYAKDNNYLANNNIFMSIKQKNNNVVIADWKAKASSDTTKYLSSDGVHPTADGQTLFAEIISSAVNNSTKTVSVCESIKGGLTNEQAEAIATYYKTDEATNGLSLPAGTKWNCVSLSAFFVQKFTTIGIQNNIAWGNGRDTARYLNQNFNVQIGSTPQPFSIFSVTTGSTMCGDSACGHTGVVVAVNSDDDIVTVEASYGNTGYTAVVHRSIDYFNNNNGTFAYLSDILNINDLYNITEQ